MHLENIIGQTFTVSNDTGQHEYICIGYSQNETFVIFGALNSSNATEFSVKSFKLTEVKFKGHLVSKMVV